MLLLLCYEAKALESYIPWGGYELAIFLEGASMRPVQAKALRLAI